MSTKTNVALVLTALAAGAALGILFAPASGKDTRKNIARKGSDLRDRLNELAHEGSELVDKLKNDARDMTNKAKDATGNIKDRVKEGANEMAGAARSASQGGYKSQV
jgi:gas vesicle protein